MLFFLPILFSLFLTAIVRSYLQSWRMAFLLAVVISGAVLTVMTEALSLVQAFTFYPTMIGWLLLVLIAGLGALRYANPSGWPLVRFDDWRLSEKTLLSIIIFVCAVSAVTAAVSSPNTWDSMTYHLARVAHWMQDKTVGFYPTNIIRQLYSSPWSEYAIAHLLILGGGLTSPNFVQWSAMAGSVVGVSLIAGQMGADRQGQLLSAAIAACLPMGILQSVSTQTDYAASFWLIVFVCFTLETIRSFSFFYCMAVGLSLGLAFLTKGYSYILALPFLCWFAIVHFRRRFLRGAAALLLIIVCAAGVNLGQWMRSTESFGSPSWTDVQLTNSAIDLKILWVNLLRNTALQLTTPFIDANKAIEQGVTSAARFFGADINDPRASFSQGFSLPALNFDEDYASNLIDAVIFMIVFILVWFFRDVKKNIRIYTLCVLASFLLFCLTVRFQPWNVRFHLPLFVLFCPVAGVVLEGLLKQRSIVVAIVLFWAAGPWLFLNHEHPWFGYRGIWKQPRIVQYFYKHADLARPYAVTANYLRSTGCRQVGLLLGPDSWEYPWWVLLANKGLRIEHVGVDNLSAPLKYPLGNFQPCAVIVNGVQPPPFIMAGTAIYGPAGSIPAGDDKISIYLRKF
jgi:Dolichyl-phosphate-mannose-protein mannosyltransferase